MYLLFCVRPPLMNRVGMVWCAGGLEQWGPSSQWGHHQWDRGSGPAKRGNLTTHQKRCWLVIKLKIVFLLEVGGTKVLNCQPAEMCLSSDYYADWRIKEQSEERHV